LKAVELLVGRQSNMLLARHINKSSTLARRKAEVPRIGISRVPPTYDFWRNKMKKIDIIIVPVLSILCWSFWATMVFLLAPSVGGVWAFIISIPIAVALTIAYVGVMVGFVLAIGFVYGMAKDLSD
jgi:hypothetical protein